MTTSELLELLRHAYDGDPWHGPSLTAVLTPVTAARAAARPVPGRHTIWEVVLHLTGWTREVARRLDGGVPAPPDGGDWPAMPAPPTRAAWTRALRALETAHRTLEKTVARMPHSRWASVVGKPAAGKPAAGMPGAGMPGVGVGKAAAVLGKAAAGKPAVGEQRDAALGTGYSYGTMVVGLATHYAYHAGQIVLLAAPPPARARKRSSRRGRARS